MTCAALIIACISIVPVATDISMAKVSVPPRNEKRAAVAIRDDVTSFQKWGSREFTLPYLERYYGKAQHFTLSGDRSQVKDFSSAVRQALIEPDTVDLYLLAHSNKLIDWVAVLPEADRQKLRLVYNTGCSDLKQGPKWLEVGAKAYVDHAGVSMSPVFYVYFLRRWTRGMESEDAVRDGNRRVSGVRYARHRIGRGTRSRASEGRFGSGHLRGSQPAYRRWPVIRLPLGTSAGRS